jgi:hypothetical protein
MKNTRKSSSKPKSKSTQRKKRSSKQKQMGNWIQNTSPLFQKWLNNTFKKYGDDNDDTTSDSNRNDNVLKKADTKIQLFSYQRLLRDFMGSQTPYRGVLIYHGLGSGKTCSAIAIAESLKMERDICVLIPASLRSNWESEFVKCGNANYANKTKLAEKYTFIHYNGLNQRIANSWGSNVFNHKLIIIDEVHNFISQVYNGGHIANRIYDILMRSTDTRFVLLSGTPIVNYPYEIALLFNLLRGYIKKFTLKVRYQNTNKWWKGNDVAHLIENVKYVNELSIDPSTQTVTVSKNPRNFINIYNKHQNKKGVLKMNDHISDTDFVSLITQKLTTHGFKVTKMDISVDTAFPHDEQLFTTQYISYDDAEDRNERKIQIINQDRFVSKIRGLVSYYKGAKPSYYPDIKFDRIIKVPLSEYGVNQHILARIAEKPLEKHSRKTMYTANMLDPNKNKANNKFSNYYKLFSRSACNFVYPEKYPNRIPEDVHLPKSEYNNIKADMMSRLEGDAKKYLTSDALPKYSPKYNKLMNNIIPVGKGTAFIYSQFKQMEGIGIFGMVLQQEGYAEFKLAKNNKGEWDLNCKQNDLYKPKYMIYSADTNIERRQAMLKIFNNDFDGVKLSLRTRNVFEKINNDNVSEGNLRGNLIHVLLATASISEGISLFNVRQLHIMEPYWGNTRITQIKGRVVRINSHIQLPERDRNVEIYMYVSTFTEEQKRKYSAALLTDNPKDSKTSDEVLLHIAQQKRKINEILLGLVRNSALDCSINHYDSCI